MGVCSTLQEKHAELQAIFCTPTPGIPAKFRSVEFPGILIGLRTTCLESGRFCPRLGVLKVDRERTEEPSA